MLLVLSKRSQESVWVGKEIERAVSCKKPIVSMHIDDSELTSEFKLYLSNTQVERVKTVDKNDPSVKKILNAIKSYTTQ